MQTGSLTVASLPGGTVRLRDARSGSTREVRLEPFSIGVVPVLARDLDPGAAEAVDRLPAHGTTWLDAARWCNAASARAGLTQAYHVGGEHVIWDPRADGYRLPTEAEWEYACRAGTAQPTYGPLAEIAWTAADGVAGPQPVGAKQPNAFGLFDMLGNIWEWCWDYADPARYGAYRTMRGGGWADRSWSCRASVRRASAPDARIEDIGFRVARGAVGGAAADTAQGWSGEADRARAGIRGPLPMGWTPLRSLARQDSRS